MFMGENRVALQQEGEGGWRGRGIVVRCPSGGRRWSAEVELPPPSPGQAPVRANFLFEVAE
jgi:hypothetical protein